MREKLIKTEKTPLKLNKLCYNTNITSRKTIKDEMLI
jgi:hypothetical protein